MVYIKYAMSVIIAAMGIYYAVQAWKLYGNAPAAEKDGFMQLEKAAELSKRNSLPILVEFTASWCKNCAVMERDTLNSPEVKAITDKDFIFVRFPAEDPDEPETAALLRAWNVQGFPAFVIVQPIKKSS